MFFLCCILCQIARSDFQKGYIVPWYLKVEFIDHITYVVTTHWIYAFQTFQGLL